jgi:hypothetical protein
MLRNTAEYERDTASAKFAPFLAKILLLPNHVSLLVTARELWWINQK